MVRSCNRDLKPRTAVWDVGVQLASLCLFDIGLFEQQRYRERTRDLFTPHESPVAGLSPAEVRSFVRVSRIGAGAQTLAFTLLFQAHWKWGSWDLQQHSYGMFMSKAVA